MNRQTPVIVGVIAGTLVFIVLALVAGGAYYLGSIRNQPPNSPSPTLASPAVAPPVAGIPLATQPPPLANVYFPSQAIAYPANWPAGLHYPEQFSPVDVSSGTLVDGGLPGWTAKLRFQGDPKSAADALASYFTANGWQIVERTDLDSGGISILIQRDGGRSGIAVVDHDSSNTAYSNIVATIFL